jgi:hypothetical protein
VTDSPGRWVAQSGPDAPNNTERWSDEKCNELSSKVAQLERAVGRNADTIGVLLSERPRAQNYVMDALTSANLANNVYKLAMAAPEFSEFIKSSRYAVGVQGVSSGIGAFGLVANFYGLTRGIEHRDSGQIVSNAAGIGLWGVMAIGASEGSAVVLAASPWVAGAAIGTFGAVKGYEYYENRQLDKAVAQTVIQNVNFLNRNVDSLAGQEALYSKHCR